MKLSVRITKESDTHRARTAGEPDEHRARTVGEPDTHRARTKGKPDMHHAHLEGTWAKEWCRGIFWEFKLICIYLNISIMSPQTY